jgi:polyhydroxyalkanoate synthase
MVTAAPKRPAESAPRMTCSGPTLAEAWPRIGTTPAELVHTQGSVRLLRYRPTGKPVGGPPVLLVMPVINRSYVVDLTPGTSFVAALQAAGVDTYMIDWGRFRSAEKNTGLDALVTRVLPRLERKVLEVSGSKELVLMGYCLGGTIAVCRAAHGPAKHHAGLVTIHTPVSFANTGALGTLTAPENFPVESILEAFGNMPGWLLQQGFSAGKPFHYTQKAKRLLERCEDKDSVEEFIALEKWNSDNVPVTGAFYQRLIQDLYRDDRLAKGTLEISGKTASLAAITCPVLVIVAKDDPICLPHQAEALLQHVSSAERSAHELTGGHVRSLTGPKARHAVAKKLAGWVAARGSNA